MAKECQDAWNSAFQMIKLENDLIHHRTTAALAVHGFLFASYCAIAAKLIENKDKEYLLLLVSIEYIIPVLGIYSSYLLRSGMSAALRQIRACDLWFRRSASSISTGRIGPAEWPPLTGRRSISEYTEFNEEERNEINDISSLCVGMDRLPVAMSLVWSIIIIAMTWFLRGTYDTCHASVAAFSLVAVLLLPIAIDRYSNARQSSSSGIKHETGRCTGMSGDIKDIDTRWRRLVAACKLEKQWTNERLGWFFTANGILLGVLAATIKIYGDNNTPVGQSWHIGRLDIGHVVLIIILIGFISSLSTVINVMSASWMHHLWFGELVDLIDNCENDRLKKTFTFGRIGRHSSFAARFSPALVPIAMLIAWVFIACKVYE